MEEHIKEILKTYTLQKIFFENSFNHKKSINDDVLHSRIVSFIHYLDVYLDEYYPESDNIMLEKNSINSIIFEKKDKIAYYVFNAYYYHIAKKRGLANKYYQKILYLYNIHQEKYDVLMSYNMVKSLFKEKKIKNNIIKNFNIDFYLEKNDLLEKDDSNSIFELCNIQ